MARMGALKAIVAAECVVRLILQFLKMISDFPATFLAARARDSNGRVSHIIASCLNCHSNLPQCRSLPA